MGGGSAGLRRQPELVGARRQSFRGCGQELMTWMPDSGADKFAAVAPRLIVALRSGWFSGNPGACRSIRAPQREGEDQSAHASSSTRCALPAN